jgi:hypothetical protein
MKRILSTVICLMALMVQGVWGAEFCVNNAANLQAALTTAQSNGADDTIKVVQGTYTGNFTYYSGQGRSIALLGGYTASCASRVINPANTVINGNQSGSALYLYDSNGSNITLVGFTVENGSTNSSGGGVYAHSYAPSGNSGAVTITNNVIVGNSLTNGSGAGVFAFSYSTSGTTGTVTLTNNIITGNSATGSSGSGGGVYASSNSNSGTAGTTTIINNIIVGNTAGYGGGIMAESDSSSGTGGTVILINNTITANSATGSGGGARIYAYGNSGGTINCYNNIIWGNTGLTGGDIYLGYSSTGEGNGYNNDYTNIYGTWTNSGNNINANPMFVLENYHLRSGSPCIDAGDNTVASLPADDFEGDPRIMDGNLDGTYTVDIGADEYGICVSTITELRSALTEAQSNGSDDIIMVVQGTYTGNFTYSSSEGHSITLLGGYTVNCASRVRNPANTILDGGGSGMVILLYDAAGGNITMDGLTVRNGTSTGYGSGVYASSYSDSGTAGTVTLTNNVVTKNSAYKASGVWALSHSQNGAAGTVLLVNNVIFENSATGIYGDGAGVLAQSSSTYGTAGTVTLVNNTITGNRATGSSGSGGGAYLSAWGSAGGGTIHCFNNIIWGNTALTASGDLLVSATTANGYNNDYATMAGIWTHSGNNINVDPLFAGNYRLLPASPCIDTGDNSPPELPSSDMIGNERVFDGDSDGIYIVDMGAYEYWSFQQCAGAAGELQSALTTAQSNGNDNTIMAVQGTYNGNFIYNSSQGKDITLLGGYTANCASRVVDPSNTILDGGGSGKVLDLSDNNGGNIVVDGFAIQKGSISGTGGGVTAYSHSGSGAAGNITLTNNIITGNSAQWGGGVHAGSYSDSGRGGAVLISNSTITGNTTTYNGGGIIADSYSSSGTAGAVLIINNTITGNTVGSVGGGVIASSYSTSGGASAVLVTNNTITGNTANSYGGVLAQAYSSSGAAGTITVTNNTITENSATSDGGAYFQVSGSSSGTLNCYNNIIWGNTGTTGGDIRLSVNGTAKGYNNDYQTMVGSWTNAGGNINLNPLFVGSGDYHLQPSSPCIDAGNNSAPGLPSTDFEEDDRVVDGDDDGTPAVDMGADEYTGLVTPLNHTICVACTLINKYQPAFEWMAGGTFKNFTILFSTSPTEFSAKGILITKANISGKKISYTPSIGTWKKIMTASDNSGSIQDIYWKVTGTKTDKTPWESAVRYFKVDDPQAIVIQTPADRTDFPWDALPTFVFDTDCNVKFQLEISSLSNNFVDRKKVQKIVFRAANPNETTILQKTLSPGQWNAVKKLIGAGGAGYFRIRAWDGINRETVSEVRSFTIQ